MSFSIGTMPYNWVLIQDPEDLDDFYVRPLAGDPYQTNNAFDALQNLLNRASKGDSVALVGMFDIGDNQFSIPNSLHGLTFHGNGFILPNDSSGQHFYSDCIIGDYAGPLVKAERWLTGLRFNGLAIANKNPSGSAVLSRSDQKPIFRNSSFYSPNKVFETRNDPSGLLLDKCKIIGTVIKNAGNNLTDTPDANLGIDIQGTDMEVADMNILGCDTGIKISNTSNNIHSGCHIMAWPAKSYTHGIDLHADWNRIVDIYIDGTPDYGIRDRDKWGHDHQIIRCNEITGSNPIEAEGDSIDGNETRN